MGRKPFKSADEKLAIVLSVLKGETTQVEIARRLQMSQTTIAKWQKQFLDGGRESLARGDNAVTLASRREVELAAYRIVQEGINNVGKHARASACTVRLTQLSDRLLIEVEDDGVGFIEDTDRPIVARGLGLISIRERANRLGGTFNILSTPGSGTRLIVSLPEAMALA